MDFISVGRGKEMSVKSDQKKQITGLLYSVCGGVLFAAGVNLFITPLDLYNGGFMGIAQLIRTFLTSALHLSFGQTDIAGIIYFIVNLPLLYLAWSKMGRGFFFRTVVTVIVETAALTFIPVPERSLIDDRLTSCVIGGLVAGFGTGLVLRGGSSGGAWVLEDNKTIVGVNSYGPVSEEYAYEGSPIFDENFESLYNYVLTLM